MNAICRYDKTQTYPQAAEEVVEVVVVVVVVVEVVEVLGVHQS